MKPKIKICGIKTREALDAAVQNGASYIGFNFYRPSPRYVTPEQAAQLAKFVPPGVQTVAVVVDPSDDELAEIMHAVKPDMIQFHGNESMMRLAEIRARYTHYKGIKAFPIAQASDFKAVKDYDMVTEFYYMFDGKAPAGAKLPGGNATSFDWKLLQGRTFDKPWFLAGGLNAKNIKEAVALSGATMVDIASGVETAPGVKSPELIKAVLHAFD